MGGRVLPGSRGVLRRRRPRPDSADYDHRCRHFAWHRGGGGGDEEEEDERNIDAQKLRESQLSAIKKMCIPLLLLLCSTLELLHLIDSPLPGARTLLAL